MQANSWLVVLLGIITLVVAMGTYIFCFVYAFAKRRLSSRASNFALAGVGLFFVASILSRVAPIAIGSTFGAAQLATAMTALGLLTSVLCMFGLVLLLVAVFIDREPGRKAPSEFLEGDQRSASRDRNPYVASPVDQE